MTTSGAPDPDQIEQTVLAHLATLGVEYEAIRIEAEYANTAAFCQRYGYAMDSSINCIVVASKTGERQHVACMVRATRRLDVNRRVRKLMGVRKASFADPSETVELTGMLPDGVTPFGLPEGMPLYIDAGALQHERIIVGGGSRKLKLLVPSQALTKVSGSVVIDDLTMSP